MKKLKCFTQHNNSRNLDFQCESLESRVMLSTVELLAAGSLGNELMELQIDEVPVQTWTLEAGADQGNLQRYVYESAETLSPNQIRVVFLNDFYDRGRIIDANLRLDAMVLDGIRYETESPTVLSTGTWRPEDGVAPGFRESEYLHANGYFHFDAPRPNGSLITVRAAGQTGQEQMRLLIDEQVVATWDNLFVVGGSASLELWESYNFLADEFVNADQIRVEFTNDAYDPATRFDNNLFVQSITIDGTNYRTDAPSVLSTGTWRSETGDARPGFFSSQALHVNGYFAFSSDTTNQGSQVLIVAGGSEGGEQMNLRISGELVRSWIVDQGANDGALHVYGFRTASTVTADQIQIEFIGNNYVPGVFDAILRVERIAVDDVEFQTESSNVFSSGTWIGDGVVPGFPQSEFLHIDGFFQYSMGTLNLAASSLANSRNTGNLNRTNLS